MTTFDDHTLSRLLVFVNEPRARLCCSAWAKHLYETLELEHRIRFHKLVRNRGHVLYHHSGVRKMGDDFEECVAYQFEIDANGHYDLAWNRSFGQWSAANERQVGRWRVRGSQLECTSTKGPEVQDGCVRFGAAGRVFELPLDDIMVGQTDGSAQPLPWEFLVRGTPVPKALSLHRLGEVASPVALASEQRAANGPTGGRPRADTRYIEVDGEMHEMSADILANYPESDWKRLMTCRIRFGLGN